MDQTIDPHYIDEYILGYEHVFDNGIVVGVSGMYRELGIQIEHLQPRRSERLDRLRHGRNPRLAIGCLPGNCDLHVIDSKT